MEKVKSYVGVFLVGVAATLTAIKLYEVLNKPKVSAPATTPSTTPGAPTE